MDLAPATQTKIFKPNLRSRGDGPLTYYVANADAVKPPLTRRWTSSLFLSDDTFCQTSAHAGMNPQKNSVDVCFTAKPRSRGDEP